MILSDNPRMDRVERVLRNTLHEVMRIQNGRYSLPRALARMAKFGVEELDCLEQPGENKDDYRWALRNMAARAKSMKRSTVPDFQKEEIAEIACFAIEVLRKPRRSSSPNT